MTALGTAIPQIIGLDTNIQIVVTTVFLIFSITIGIFIMKKSRFTLSDYGFRKSKKDSYFKVWWYIPLLAVEIIPIVLAGFSSEVTVQQYIILLLFTVAVGFNEEIYFRGLALKMMDEKGSKKAIIWSSIIFGVLHLANAFNGKNALYLTLQMIFAFLVGFVLAEIVSISKSLWIVIIWHAAHDYISCITSEVLDTTALIVLAIQVGILLVYAICIWSRSNVDDTVTLGVTD
jgi:membrane protease YdiL (CAAX protease family)